MKDKDLDTLDCFDYEKYLDRLHRRPKNRSIEELHDLWLRSILRNEPRMEEYIRVRDLIVKKIPKNEYGYHIVSYEGDEEIHTFEFSYSDEFKGWGVSNGTLKLEDRDQVLDHILNDDIKFKLGEEFNVVNNLVSELEHYIFRQMWDKVQDNLRNKFREENVHPPKTFVIKIGDHEYSVITDNDHRYSCHPNFEFGEQIPNRVIDLK